MEQPKQSFFQRHPGFDAYSLFWLVLFLILAALGRFFLPLLIPAGVVLVYLLFRLLSKDQEKRQMENARFYALFRSIRVPRGLGKIEVTCKACSSRFEVRS